MLILGWYESGINVNEFGISMFQIADNKFEVFGTVLLLLALFVSWFVHLPQKFGWNFPVVGDGRRVWKCFGIIFASAGWP